MTALSTRYDQLMAEITAPKNEDHALSEEKKIEKNNEKFQTLIVGLKEGKVSQEVKDSLKTKLTTMVSNGQGEFARKIADTFPLSSKEWLQLMTPYVLQIHNLIKAHQYKEAKKIADQAAITEGEWALIIQKTDVPMFRK